MIALLLLLLLVTAPPADAFIAHRRCFNDVITTASTLSARHSGGALFAGRKDAEKEEQWRIQQEMLARRKDKTKMKQYFERRENERKNVASKMRSWSRTKDSIDPLQQWKASKARGEVKPLGYEEAPGKSDSRLGITFTLPQSPIDLPAYDNGERFDLRLPYAERGYEDPDADVMKKMGDAFSSLWGGGKKKQQVKEPVETAMKSKNSAAVSQKKVQSPEEEKKKSGWFW